MPRLFVAVEIPAEIKRSIAASYSGRGIRWTPEGQLHLTLRFLGEVRPEHVTAVEDTLAGIRLSPFTVTVAGSGCFPSPQRPRVVWIGLAGGNNLLQLQRRVEAAVRAAGLPAEDKPFRPHITVGRIRDATKTEVEQALLRLQVPRAVFSVGAFHLYSSRLTPQGAIHCCERTYSLADTAEEDEES